MAGITVPRQRPIATMRRDPSSPWRHLDIGIAAIVGIVATLGMVMVYSATRGAEQPWDTSFLKKQVLFVVVGLLAMAGTALFDYRKIGDYAPFIYGATMIMLVAVLLVGSRQRGTQGWFQLGPFQLQPSELAKVGLIVGLAYLASQFRGEVDLRRFSVLLAAGGLPVVLVLLQPDLGTAMVTTTILSVMLIVGGARGAHLAVLGVVAVVGVAVVLQSGMLDDFQQDRLTTFIEQDEAQTQLEARGASYNLNQSKIAIGSGGLWGRGLFEGSQTRAGRVPEQHTDFIFTAVGEELGLIGAGGLLALYGVLLWRIWRTARLARDLFGSLLCAGVLAMFLVQIFENVGMTMGIMPITGIPLPFMSYGGSGILTAFIAMGLVLNVHMRRFS